MVPNVLLEDGCRAAPLIFVSLISLRQMGRKFFQSPFCIQNFSYNGVLVILAYTEKHQVTETLLIVIRSEMVTEKSSNCQ